MLARRVIPCLDVTGGRVVKGTRFLELRDAGDPVELAAFYDRGGADELVFLDITASSDARAILIDVVKATADQVFIPLTVGGGVRTVGDMTALLESGADKTAVNTAALDRPDLITEGARLLGAQCVVLAIDAKRRSDVDGWTVYSHGGRIDSGRDAVVIASGGAGEPEHLRAALAEGAADAALAASIFHFGEYSIADAKSYLAEHKVPVRLEPRA